jgi:2-polyprenyl-3-methyl-5-hydroxy-6-metoxy-1,4-benzoquinol methylase
VTDQMRPDPADDVIAILARQLDAAQRAVGTGDDGDPLGALAQALVALSEVPGGPAGPAAPSTIRRGEAIDAIAAGLADVAARLDAQREAVATALTALSEAVDRVAAGRHRHAGLERELDALHDRFTRAERHGSLRPSDDDLLRRVEALEAAEAARRFEPWFSSTRFAEAFRGSAEALAERYADLADALAGTGGPVLDLGCGTGDLMALVAERGVDVRGIDTDAEAVDGARARGLDAAVGDGLAELAALEPASLGALACIQVVEHLSSQQLVELVARAAEVVRPGGLVVAETVNPGSLYVYGHALYLDPTHTTPIHPAYLAFCFEQAGFAKVDVQMRSEPPADERLPRVEGSEAGSMNDALTDGVNRVVDQLNAVLYGPQDYAVLAVR